MKRFNSVALVLSKILEIVHWIGCAGMIMLFIASIAAKESVSEAISRYMPLKYGAEPSVYGFSIVAADSEGRILPVSITVFSIGAIIILSLMAMVFRNAYLIFKTSKGKTRLANGETPFQKDITRMVREIGIFYISVPIVGLVMSIIARIVIGAEIVETSVSMGGIVTGILIICLSQVFAYGTQLQDDMDGLL